MTSRDEEVKQCNFAVICKLCGSTHTRKHGFVEGMQYYFCNDCKHRFSANDHLYQMKTPYAQVARALDDYYTGKSIADIRNSMGATGHPPSTKSIYGWITKYTDEAIDQFKDYHPQVGNDWVADETVLRLNGKNTWCIDIIDADTRFLLATKLSSNREIKDIKELMELARDRAGKTPKRVLTDGWKGYIEGIEQAYGADSKHIVTEPFAGKDKDNTELIERWHGTLKERTKTLRGLKSVETANKFLGGFLVFYNYVRPHEYLNGGTPAEAAKVSYPAKTWADIIRVAKPQVEVLVTPSIVDKLSERKTMVRPIAHRRYDLKRKNELRKLHRKINRRKGKLYADRRNTAFSRHYFRGARSLSE